jgi:hypothetical protein
MNHINYYDVTIKKYGSEYKISYIPIWEGDRLRSKVDFPENEKIGDKFESNVIRAKSKVIEYGLCNSFDMFITATLDSKKYDRYNLEKFRKNFTQFIRNQKRLTGRDLIYVLIPEPHQDGAWHFHGLVGGWDWQELKKFEKDKHPDKLVEGGFRYDPKILERFGYNSFAKIKSQTAVAKYITKYITKDITISNMVLGSHIYYASNGLKGADIVAQGVVSEIKTKIDFENEFCKNSWVKEKDIKKIMGDLK